MSIDIFKSKYKDGYYINGKGVLLANWDYHKKAGFFSDQEINAFENYLKSIKKNKNPKT